MGESLIGYFVPFRSPTLDDLGKKEESFEFGRNLWQAIFKQIHPKLIACIDKETHRLLLNMIPDSFGACVADKKQLPTGWGDCRADITYFAGEHNVRLLRLPHLSRFLVFSSKKCVEPMNHVMEVACCGLSQELEAAAE